MIKTIKKFGSFVYSKYFGACCAIAALAPVAAFAQEGETAATDITIPDAFANFSWTAAIKTIGDKIQPAIIAVIGLAVGVWIVQLIWRKIRSVMG